MRVLFFMLTSTLFLVQSVTQDTTQTNNLPTDQAPPPNLVGIRISNDRNTSCYFASALNVLAKIPAVAQDLQQRMVNLANVYQTESFAELLVPQANAYPSSKIKSARWFLPAGTIVPGPENLACGIVQEEGMDFTVPGVQGQPINPLNAETYQDCKYLCFSDKDCVSFNFHEGQKLCQLCKSNASWGYKYQIEVEDKKKKGTFKKQDEFSYYLWNGARNYYFTWRQGQQASDELVSHLLLDIISEDAKTDLLVATIPIDVPDKVKEHPIHLSLETIYSQGIKDIHSNEGHAFLGDVNGPVLSYDELIEDFGDNFETSHFNSSPEDQFGMLCLRYAMKHDFEYYVLQKSKIANDEIIQHSFCQMVEPDIINNIRCRNGNGGPSTSDEPRIFKITKRKPEYILLGRVVFTQQGAQYWNQQIRNIKRITEIDGETYEMIAVSIKQGDHSSGHYFTYVKDTVSQKPEWWKINDGSARVQLTGDKIAGKWSQKYVQTQGVNYLYRKITGADKDRIKEHEALRETDDDELLDQVKLLQTQLRKALADIANLEKSTRYVQIDDQPIIQLVKVGTTAEQPDNLEMDRQPIIQIVKVGNGAKGVRVYQTVTKEAAGKSDTASKVSKDKYKTPFWLMTAFAILCVILNALTLYFTFQAKNKKLSDVEESQDDVYQHHSFEIKHRSKHKHTRANRHTASKHKHTRANRHTAAHNTEPAEKTVPVIVT